MRAGDFGWLSELAWLGSGDLRYSGELRAGRIGWLGRDVVSIDDIGLALGEVVCDPKVVDFIVMSLVVQW